MNRKLPRLPRSVRVKTLLTKQGTFIAELSEYDVFTEADSKIELLYNVNDLIYAYFEVPKEYQGKIWYRPEKPEAEFQVDKSVLFNVLVSPNLRLPNYQ